MGKLIGCRWNAFKAILLVAIWMVPGTLLLRQDCLADENRSQEAPTLARAAGVEPSNNRSSVWLKASEMLAAADRVGAANVLRSHVNSQAGAGQLTDEQRYLEAMIQILEQGPDAKPPLGVVSELTRSRLPKPITDEAVAWLCAPQRLETASVVDLAAALRGLLDSDHSSHRVAVVCPAYVAVLNHTGALDRAGLLGLIIRRWGDDTGAALVLAFLKQIEVQHERDRHAMDLAGKYPALFESESLRPYLIGALVRNDQYVQALRHWSKTVRGPRVGSYIAGTDIPQDAGHYASRLAAELLLEGRPRLAAQVAFETLKSNTLSPLDPSNGEPVEMVDFFELSSGAGQSTPAAIYLIASLEYAMGDRTRAEELLGALQDLSPSEMLAHQIALLRCSISIDAGDCEKARRHLNDATAAYVDSKLLADFENRLTEARNTAERETRLQSEKLRIRTELAGSVAPQETAGRLIRLASIERKLGKYDQALDVYNRLIELNTPERTTAEALDGCVELLRHFSSPESARHIVPVALNNSDFAMKSLEDWYRPTWAKGKIELNEESGNWFVRLAGEPDKNAVLQRDTKVDPDWDELDVEFKIHYEDIKQGEKSWHKGQVQFRFLNRAGEDLGLRKYDAALLGSGQGWELHRQRIPVPEGAERFQILFALTNVERGTLDVDDLKISATGLIQKRCNRLSAWTLKHFKETPQAEDIKQLFREGYYEPADEFRRLGNNPSISQTISGDEIDRIKVHIDKNEWKIIREALGWRYTDPNVSAANHELLCEWFEPAWSSGEVEQIDKSGRLYHRLHGRPELYTAWSGKASLTEGTDSVRLIFDTRYHNPNLGDQRRHRERIRIAFADENENELTQYSVGEQWPGIGEQWKTEHVMLNVPLEAKSIVLSFFLSHPQESSIDIGQIRLDYSTLRQPRLETIMQTARQQHPDSRVIAKLSQVISDANNLVPSSRTGDRYARTGDLAEVQAVSQVYDWLPVTVAQRVPSDTSSRPDAQAVEANPPAVSVSPGSADNTDLLILAIEQEAAGEAESAIAAYRKVLGASANNSDTQSIAADRWVWANLDRLKPEASASERLRILQEGVAYAAMTSEPELFLRWTLWQLKESAVSGIDAVTLWQKALTDRGERLYGARLSNEFFDDLGSALATLHQKNNQLPLTVLTDLILLAPDLEAIYRLQIKRADLLTEMGLMEDALAASAFAAVVGAAAGHAVIAAEGLFQESESLSVSTEYRDRLIRTWFEGISDTPPTTAFSIVDSRLRTAASAQWETPNRPTSNPRREALLWAMIGNHEAAFAATRENVSETPASPDAVLTATNDAVLVGSILEGRPTHHLIGPIFQEIAHGRSVVAAADPQQVDTTLGPVSVLLWRALNAPPTKYGTAYAGVGELTHGAVKAIQREYRTRQSKQMMRWGASAYRSGRPLWTEQLWSQALSQAAYPDEAVELILLAENLIRDWPKSLDATEVQELYRNMLHRLEGSPDRQVLVLNNLANYLYTRGEYSSTLAVIDELAEKQSTSPGTYEFSFDLMHAVSLLQTGQISPALNMLESLETREGNDALKAQALFLIGWARLKQGDETSAIAAFRRLTSIYPQEPYAERAQAILLRLAPNRVEEEHEPGIH